MFLTSKTAEIQLDEGAREGREKVWGRELGYRLFMLNQRRIEHGKAQQAPNSEMLPSVQAPECLRKESSEETIMPSLQDPSFGRDSSPKKPSEQTGEPSEGAKESNYVLVRFIPPLPKTIEEASKYWRFGCPVQNFKPVRLFQTAKKRKELISGYKNKMWSSTGQKNLYLRYRSLMELLADYALEINIFKEGRNCSWDRAIQHFHDDFDRNGKTKGLSTILKECQNNEKSLMKKQ